MLFLQWILMGFVLAAPIGPIGVLCIHRTLLYGKSRWIATGLGAASADVVYAGIAAFGLNLISEQIFEYQQWAQIIGVCALIYFGVKTFHTKMTLHDLDSQKGKFGDYFWAFFLNLIHPSTLLAVSLIVIAVPKSHGNDFLTFLFFASISLGSILCWLLLVLSTAAMRKRIHESRIFHSLHKIFGTIILLCALGLAFAW